MRPVALSVYPRAFQALLRAPLRRALRAPLRAPLWRAVAEGAAGCAVLLGLAALAGAGGRDPFSAPAGAIILTLLASVWLACWPAWRLSQTGGRPGWKQRMWVAGRLLLCGLLLGLAQLLLESWVPAPVFESSWVNSAIVAEAALGFLGARLVVAVAAALVRRGRRRLLWQLTASHLAIMLLTFATMTALGSIAVVSLVYHMLHADARTMAVSAADLLRLADSATPLHRGRLEPVLAAIEQGGRVQLQGQSLLATTESSTAATGPKPVVPIRVMVLRRDGTVLAAAMAPPLAHAFHIARATAPLPATLWRRLRPAVLAGRSLAIAVPVVMTIDKQVLPVRNLTGVAPIVDRAGRPIAVAVVQVFDVAPLPLLLLPNILSIFLLALFLLALALALPVLGIASLFGYLLSRGLTRHLEAVSRVATAIAAGDLTERAPVTARNEVGRLAQDVNHMAAHLETTVGALHEARRQAEEALRARQELVANISHELRTPLAIVRAHLDTLLLRHPVAPAGVPALPEAATEVAVPASTVRALQNETERLAGLVDDLFALSRAQSGALDVHCDRVDVAALVGEVAALMRPLAQREGMIALTVEAPPGLPPALADPDRLRQILENLVRNAVRHTPDGGIIVLSATAEGPWIVAAVVDTGEGIPPEHLPHIFDRFYRVEQARTRSGGGAGLGLAIVREFVELMGGRVAVESTPGEGSCFRVFLPLAPNIQGS